MNLQLFIKFNKDLFAKTTKDGLFILSKDEKNLYILKGIANFICEKANGKNTVKDVIEDIAEEFNMDLDIVKKDVVAFLEHANREEPDLFIFSEHPA